MSEISISIVRPKGYQHVDCFVPLVSSLANAFESVGYKVNVLYNVYTSEHTSVVVGAHLLENPLELVDLKKAIIYNFEQISPESHWITKNYFKALSTIPYWDYSSVNIKNALAVNNRIQAHHVPFAYAAPLDYTYAARDCFRVVPKDIDVLFFGSMNERRAKIIDQLRDMGLKVQSVFGVYGSELSVLIHRAKVVLNMHYYESSIFEAVRVIPLLATRVAVVSEKSVDDEDYKYLGAPFGIQITDYANLADCCRLLVQNDEARSVLAAQGNVNVKFKTMLQSVESVRSML